MALKNTTFRLSDEDIAELKALSELTGLKSGELKRKVVRIGLQQIRDELEGKNTSSTVPAAFAQLISQQKRLSETVERQLGQAEKMVERQRNQVESVVDRMSSQQRRLQELIEKQVGQAERAIEQQKNQVERLLANVVAQQRRIGDQVREHFPRLSKRRVFDRRSNNRGEVDNEPSTP